MRQRIVINLDEPKTEAAKRVRKPRRWVRVLAIIGTIVLVAVGIAVIEGLLWLRQYRASPTYALALMFDAAQHDDIAGFQRRIDEDEIAKNISGSVSQKAAARYGYALNSSIQQQIDSTMPSLLPRVKQTVHTEFFNAMKSFARAPEEQSFFMILGLVKRLMTVTTDGDSAKATGIMAGHNLDMTMRRDAVGWKVVDVKDDLIVQGIVDSVMKELPAVGNIDANSPLLLKKPQRKRAGRGR